MIGTSWRPSAESIASPRSPWRRAWLLTLASAFLGLAAACGEPGESRPAPALHFADFIDHQAGQVTTRLILPEDAANGALPGSGWYRLDNDDGTSELGHRPHLSTVQFFSADAATQGVEIVYRQPLPFTLAAQVNGHWAGRLVATDNPRIYRVAFPPPTVRQGWNALRLLTPEKAAAGELPETVQVIEIRFLPETPGSSNRIIRRLEDSGDGETLSRRFVMPGDSYLDLVASLPEDPRWTGRFAVSYPKDAKASSLRVRAELLDQGGAAHVLLEQVFEESNSGESFELELLPWARQTVRLRLAVSGGAGAEVRWHTARVSGTGDGWSPPLAAIDPLHQPTSSGRLGRPDVFIVVLDAARADAFGSYGAAHPTPAIDELARHGTRFANATSTVPWTGPSVPALLTGLYPDSLGIEHWNSRLRPGVRLVQEALRDDGYHTVLWSQHPFYRDRSALRRGFTDFHSSRDWVGVVPEAADLLATDRPTFALIHLLPPHTPYEPPRPFRGAYTESYAGSVSVDAEFLNQFPNRLRPEDISEDDRTYIHRRYLEMVAFADSLVGRIVNSLKQAGRYDDALIVVLSDHGEAFLEHDHFLHSRRLYREFLHVPWVIKWPAGTSGFEPVIESPVSLVDLTPTLIDALGLPAADHRLQGISLLPQVFDGALGRRGTYAVTRGAAPQSRWPRPSAALSLDGWKLIYDLEFHRAELYDLVADPDEQNDRATAEPWRTEHLRQLLLRQHHLNDLIRSDLGEAAVGEIDPEVERQLKALGYL